MEPITMKNLTLSKGSIYLASFFTKNSENMLVNAAFRFMTGSMEIFMPEAVILG